MWNLLKLQGGLMMDIVFSLLVMSAVCLLCGLLLKKFFFKPTSLYNSPTEHNYTSVVQQELNNEGRYNQNTAPDDQVIETEVQELTRLDIMDEESIRKLILILKRIIKVKSVPYVVTRVASEELKAEEEFKQHIVTNDLVIENEVQEVTGLDATNKETVRSLILILQRIIDIKFAEHNYTEEFIRKLTLILKRIIEGKSVPYVVTRMASEELKSVEKFKQHIVTKDLVIENKAQTVTEPDTTDKETVRSLILILERIIDIKLALDAITCIASEEQNSTNDSSFDITMSETTPVIILSKDIERGKAVTSNNSYWIDERTPIRINQFNIEQGMVYYGSGLKGANSYEIECALIDPKLPIDSSQCDYRIRQMDYWPSYSEISPQARSAYLNWLSSGRNDPEVDIGYVFLYYYGLERRLLYDVESEFIYKNEIKSIVAEVERLLNIYGNNRSFNTYANSLLTFIKADDFLKTNLYEQAAPNATYHTGLPIKLIVGLGQLVKDGVAIPADWALSWYLSSVNPHFISRTPAKRCKEEFRKIFEEEYVRIFGDGLILEPEKENFNYTYTYQPASRSLLGIKSYGKLLDIPNISTFVEELDALTPIIQYCHDRLGSYSRFLGKNPEMVGSLDAILELPASIWPSDVKNIISQIKSEVSQSSDPIEITFSLFTLKLPEWKDRSKQKMSLLLNALERYYQLGVEPDCRIGGIIPEADSSVFIFELDPDSTDRVFEPNYAVIALAMNLCVLVFQEDKDILEKKITLLVNQVNKWVSSFSEQQRLKVYIRYLEKQQLQFVGQKKRIGTLNLKQKEMVANIVTQVVLTNGTFSVSVMRMMERITNLLGIEYSFLYNKMHQMAAEPITVISGSSDIGFSIPIHPDKTQIPIDESIHLDMNKVASLQVDSEKVAAILGAVFNEDGALQDNVNVEKPKTPLNNTTKVYWGLPANLSEMVQMLIAKSTWNRAELAIIVQNRGLMLDGTLEQINEAAYDNFDQPFAEGEEIIEINQEIVKVMNK